MKIKIVICVSVFAVLMAVLGVFFLKNHNASYVITEQEIQNRILINEITNEIYADCFSKSLQDTDSEKYIEKYSKSTNRDDVVNELICAKIMRTVLKAENCSVEYEKAKETAEQEFVQMKTDETSAEYRKSIETVLDMRNITEEEYIKLLYDYAYDIYTESNFNSWFLKNKYQYDDSESGSAFKYADEYPEKEKQIKEYLDKKIDKAKIIIK